MAQVYKRKGTPYWYYKFQLNGTAYRFSTGKKKKAEAQEVLRRKLEEVGGQVRIDGIAEELLAALRGLPSPEQDVARHSVVRRILEAQNNKVEVTDAWKAWLGSPRRRNPGRNTLAGYDAIWRRFKSWLISSHPDIRFLHETDANIAEGYAANLWGSGITARTYNAHVGFLKSMFNVLAGHAGLRENPWADLPRMSGRTESRRRLTAQELERIILDARGNLRAILLVGIYTGMRLGDVCLLKWSCIDLQGAVIDYVPLKTRNTGKSIRVPIHPVLASTLDFAAKISESEYVFPVEAETYVRDRRAAALSIRRHFEACGITTTERSSDSHRRRAIARAGFHSLRHSFVSLCAAGGVPQVALMELVGHGSPAMTRLYSHAGEDQKRKAIALLPAYGLADSEHEPARFEKTTKGGT